MVVLNQTSSNANVFFKIGTTLKLPFFGVSLREIRLCSDFADCPRSEVRLLLISNYASETR